ncbi:MAG TPA: ion transporter [Gammaproteobacteria bacterium]|nr:ion transporter [Gammaproteobacteria bacterium]
MSTNRARTLLDAAAEIDAARFGRPAGGWRRRLYGVIFESDTPEGLLFDRALLVTILASVGVVMLDSVVPMASRYHGPLVTIEWLVTALFTIEYVARLICVDRPWRYVCSFYGLVDLASVLPTYLAIFLPELHALIDVRVLRMLRVFRILKLTQYLAEFQLLGAALSASRRKIAVFLSAVLMIVVTLGTVMYVVEGPANGFTSIPVSVYWAITTMTTVGFGDIAPHTSFGRLVASVMMLMGWGVLAVPTGIVTAEITSQRLRVPTGRGCAKCGAGQHTADSRYCRVCGERLGA